MKRQPVLAIDLGSTKVACAIGQRRLDQGIFIPGQPQRPPFELLGCGIAEHEGFAPSDPIELAKTIERALGETGVARVPDRCVVALSHPALQHRQVTAQIDLADEPVTIRRMDLERVQTLAVTQALSIDREILSIEPLGYDGNGFSRVQDPRGLTATRLSGTFHLMTIPLAVRRATLQALELLGVELERMASSLNALVASCVVDESSRERLLLVDLGGSSSDLALLDHGRLANAHTIPWGGNVVVEAVARACRVPLDRALTITRQGLTHTKPQVKGVVEQQFEALREQAEHILRDGLPPSRAIVTGRTALIDGVVEWFERATGVPATLGRSPWAHQLGDVPRQVALTPVLGMLALATDRPTPAFPHLTSSRLIDRLLNRTKQILVEYF